MAATALSDSAIPGCSMTQFQTTVKDPVALDSYLQNGLKTYVNSTCDPAQGRVAVFTQGSLSAADASSLTALMQNYSNPAPVTPVCVSNTGLSSSRVANSDWTVVHCVPSSTDPVMNLQGGVVNAAVVPSDTAVSRGSLSYSLRIVDVDRNLVIGSFTGTNTAYADATMPTASVGQAVKLELQGRCTTSAYLDVKTWFLNYTLA